jgi:hypothetical protein
MLLLSGFGTNKCKLKSIKASEIGEISTNGTLK